MVPPVYRLAVRGFKNRRWIPALVLCLGLACCRSSQAQFFDATSLREPADLAATWLIHGGDDPAYARPGFDDSNWIPFNATTDDLRNVFPKDRPQIVWYRLHVKVGPNNKGLALLEKDAPTAFELYSNGAMLLKVGEVKPYVHYDTSARILVPVPDSQLSKGTILIALRARIDDLYWPFPQPGLQAANFKIGQQEVLRTYKWYSLIGNRALEWLDDLVNLCLMLGALLLFCTQRNRREYLWLFLWVFAGIPSWAVSLASMFYTYRFTWHILDMVNGGLWPYLVARMYCAFVGHRIGWKLNLYLGLCSLAWVLLFLQGLFFGYSTSLAQQEIIGVPQFLLCVVVLPLIMLRQIHRDNRAEGLLIVPLLIYGLAYFAFYLASPALTTIFPKRDWLWLGRTTIGPFVVSYSQVADILSMLSLALIVLIRSNRASRQQSLLEAEIANARAVQQFILPEPVQSIPGFRIECIYEPAREVGGTSTRFFRRVRMVCCL
jgi:sigma-B regulation protein RsbU (phosphoserine phosphatase)